jgi:hypothetical protein
MPAIGAERVIEALTWLLNYNTNTPTALRSTRK